VDMLVVGFVVLPLDGEDRDLEVHNTCRSDIILCRNRT
jgi:hypothetical protein